MSQPSHPEESRPAHDHENSPDWFPLEPQDHERQLDGLRTLLAPGPKRVLDLGCGDGRIARPLAHDGHTVFALDNDERALQHCAAPNITTILANANDPGAFDTIESPLDAVLCLGNTFLLFADPMQTLDLLQRLRARLAGEGVTAGGVGGGGGGGGMVVLDAFPEPLWREVADGNWQEGIAEDGTAQLLWADADNVIAIREGPDIADSDWTFRPTDTPLRLWSMGELRLLAHGAGYSPPDLMVHEHLLILRPHDR